MQFIYSHCCNFSKVKKPAQVVLSEKPTKRIKSKMYQRGKRINGNVQCIKRHDDEMCTEITYIITGS